MLHPDYQYDSRLIKYFVEYIRDGYFDVMLGSRIRSRKETLAGGMPIYKYYANRFLSFVENLATGIIYLNAFWYAGLQKRSFRKIPYKEFSDDFIFDTQVLFSVIEKGYKIGDIPVPVRYFKEASSINFKKSLKYGLTTLGETMKFFMKRISMKLKK